jgi:hypothetical protein
VGRPLPLHRPGQRRFRARLPSLRRSQSACLAHMVASAADYAWSNFRRDTLGKSDPLLSDHPAYAGSDRRGKHVGKYTAHCLRIVSTRNLLLPFHDATQGGQVAGSERFRSQVAAPRGRPPSRSSSRQNPKSPCRSGAPPRVKRSTRQNDSGSFFRHHKGRAP